MPPRLLPEGTVVKESGVLDRVSADALVRDAAALLRIPSVTGDERPALETSWSRSLAS
jgi:hypothetical protein